MNNPMNPSYWYYPQNWYNPLNPISPIWIANRAAQQNATQNAESVQLTETEDVIVSVSVLAPLVLIAIVFFYFAKKDGWML